MKHQSFHVLRGRGETEFRQGLRVENGTTNHLLSLIIALNNERSKLTRFAQEGGIEFRQLLRVENGTTNRNFSLIINER